MNLVDMVLQPLILPKFKMEKLMVLVSLIQAIHV